MNIIFDLDGTLIDSSHGILRSLKLAFNSCNVELKEPLTSKLIGPPLKKLLPILAGTDEPALIASIATAFKDSYDSEGYKESAVFNDVELMLDELKQQGNFICLATNKRIVPTRKLIEYLGWGKFFSHVYALDSFADLDNKSELIAKVMNIHSLEAVDTIYIGDTVADKKASLSNKLHYVMALWGYDSGDTETGVFAEAPSDVVQHINNLLSEAWL